MKLTNKIILILLSFFMYCCSKENIITEPENKNPNVEINFEILNVVSKIDKKDVTKYITHLENYKTRFMFANNRLEIAKWIQNEFKEMGFANVVIDSFLCETKVKKFKLPFIERFIDTVTTQYNIIAELKGSERPEDIYIIGGHYDSFLTDSDMFKFAPGANDNASGTTSVLMSAKAVMQANYKPKSTLKFIAFGAEELMHFGYSGSEYYVDKALVNKEKIKFMINNDMIGYSPNYPNDKRVKIYYNSTQIESILKLCSAYSNLEFIKDD